MKKTLELTRSLSNPVNHAPIHLLTINMNLELKRKQQHKVLKCGRHQTNETKQLVW